MLWSRRRYQPFSDRTPLRDSMGLSRDSLALYSLHRALGRGNCTERIGSGGVRRLGLAARGRRNFCDLGTLYQYDFGALALWRQRGRLSSSFAHFGGFLDVGVGTYRIGYGNPIDGLSGCPRQTRSAAKIHHGAHERPARGGHENDFLSKIVGDGPK